MAEKKIKHMGLHDKFMQKDGPYAKWHRHPMHKIGQWALLLLVVGSVGYLLVNRTNDPYAENYGLNSKASNQGQDGPPNLFKGETFFKESGKYGLEAEEDDVNTDLIERGTDKMKIKLPGERNIVVSKKKFEKRGMGDAVWHGEVEGRSDSSVSITLKNGFVAGAINIGGELYEIRPGQGTKHTVEKMDSTAFPPESDVHLATADDTLSQDALTGSGAVLNEGVVQIDLLSVYTPQARTAAGGVAQIDSLIQAAVDRANLSFTNSQVNAHYNLVATAEVAYNDSGTTSTDLYWLRSDANVASLRNQYGADMVSMMVSNGGSACGTGFLYTASASSAFQVTDMDCAVGNLTFAHEHGHNLGMGHDPSTTNQGIYSYSWGHGVNGVFRTVMAYASACSSGCTRLPYFSNPNVMYSGYATGIADQRDHARTANQTVATVAGFRSAPGSTNIPASPSSLSASAVSTSQIKLTWTDNAVDELGFKVQRSLDGANFTQIADIGTNVTSYTNSGLAANTTYYYRILAYNSAGDSGSSNIANATTFIADIQAPSVSITSPVDGAKISGSRVEIAATASDNVGVTSVQFYIDGKASGSDTSASYTYRWNVNRKVANGSHTIMARAYDAAGNSSTSSITVTK